MISFFTVAIPEDNGSDSEGFGENRFLTLASQMLSNHTPPKKYKQDKKGWI